MEIDTKDKKVLITGVSGQMGSVMSDYLLEKYDDIKIYGGVRRLSVKNHDNIRHLKGNDRFELVDLELTDPVSVSGVVSQLQPDYILNFAANSYVGNSWEMPRNHMEVNAMGVMNFLEAIRIHSPHTRLYQSSSSEMFGDVVYSPQTEEHPLRPRSPYGASKVSGHVLTKVYRESYGIFATAGIMFNTESPVRGLEFLTRKVTSQASMIAQKMMRSMDWEPIKLGNMSAKRDWSHAKDSVDAIWRIVNQDKYNKNFENIKDYIIASGETHSVAEFVDKTFDVLGIDGYFYFDTDGVDDWEKASYRIRWAEEKPLVVIDKDFFRPAEVDLLLGDSTALRKDLGWEPKYNFNALVEDMVNNDLQIAKKKLSQ
jgi:GDPmannose 4,6-dehydratase